MADDAGTVAGNAAPDAGEKPAESQPSPTGRTYSQSDLDAITEKVRATARKQWETEQAEKARQSEMTEAQKAQAAADKAARELAEERTLRIRYERRDAVLTAADSFVPHEFIDAALNGANGDDFDAAAVAAKAKERWDASLARAGVMSSASIPKPSPPRTGGTPAVTDSSNLGARTAEDAQQHAYSLNAKSPGLGTKWWNEQVKPFLAEGGRFKE